MNNVSQHDVFTEELEEPPGQFATSTRSAELTHFATPAGVAFSKPLPARLSYAEHLRFYRHVCPPFPHEPTRDRFAVVKTDAVGEGLIALVDFAPGDVVFSFAGTTLSHQTLFTLQVQPGQYLEDPLVMGKVLHSCDPNMVCSMEHLTFWALKPIRANDYLFMDYETTEDKLFRHFDCCCGAADCRGQIRGRSFLSPAQRTSVPTFADYASHRA